jgi:hypothetical protein
MPASDPRLSSLRPVLEYQPRASLADRQPAWESGLAQRILAEKMGGRGEHQNIYRSQQASRKFRKLEYGI